MQLRNLCRRISTKKMRLNCTATYEVVILRITLTAAMHPFQLDATIQLLMKLRRRWWACRRISRHKKLFAQVYPQISKRVSQVSSSREPSGTIRWNLTMPTDPRTLSQKLQAPMQSHSSGVCRRMDPRRPSRSARQRVARKPPQPRNKTITRRATKCRRRIESIILSQESTFQSIQLTDVEII